MGNKAEIELRYSIYETEPVVKLIFAYDSDLIRLLIAHTKVRWSNTLLEKTLKKYSHRRSKLTTPQKVT
jgi:hypothetical protein